MRRLAALFVVVMFSFGCGALSLLSPCAEDRHCDLHEVCREGRCKEAPLDVPGDAGPAPLFDGGLVDAGIGDAGPNAPLALFAVEPKVVGPGQKVALSGQLFGELRVRFPSGVEVVVPAGDLDRRHLVVEVPSDPGQGPLTVLRKDGSKAVRLPFAGLGFRPRPLPTSLELEQTAYARDLSALTQERYDGVFFAAGPYLYAIGGAAENTPTDTIERARIFADGSLGPFESEAPLTVERHGPAAVVAGGYLYVLGGESEEGVLYSVERAEILEDGSLSPFTLSVAGLRSARAHFPAVLVEDRLYAFGGRGGAPESYELAKIDERGDIQAPGFVHGGELPSPFVRSAAVQIGDALCLFGANPNVTNAPPAETIACAPIEAGAVLGPFSILPTGLLRGRYGHGVVLAKNRLYVVGGLGRRDVEQALLDRNAALGPFEQAPISLVEARRSPACAVIGDFVYVVGGYGAQGELRSIERAPIEAGDALGPFVAVDETLTHARGGLCLGVLGAQVYALGGTLDGLPVRLIDAAPFGPSGLEGTFADQGLRLYRTRSAFTSLVLGARLFSFGGRTQTRDDNTYGHFALAGAGLVADGAVIISGGNPRSGHQGLAYRDTAYLLGGMSDGIPLGDLVRGELLPQTGLVGALIDAATLATPRHHASVVLAGGALYALGGIDGDGHLRADVERLPLGQDGRFTGAFQAVPETELSVPDGARAEACALRVGDSVYLIGGAFGDGATPSAGVFRARVAAGP